jgi:hypothetical protein
MGGVASGIAKVIVGGVSMGKKLLLLPREGFLLFPKPPNMDEELGKPGLLAGSVVGVAGRLD